MRLFLKKYWKMLVILVFVILVGAGLLVFAFSRDNRTQYHNAHIPGELEFDYQLRDNQELYIDKDMFKVYTVYMTVFTGLDSASGLEFDLEMLNGINGFEHDPELKSSVYIVDEETGQVVGGDSAGEMNSTVELRGQSARSADQKSYKINLSRSTDLFQGQRELNLNKHSFDKTRVAQKFSFDSMIGIDSFISARSNFMNLYIKDGTDPEAVYENYGLFTHIENVDENYLSVRGLDENANLLKPLDFAFTMREAELIENGQSRTLFRDINKSSGSKLTEMLKAVNTDSIEFDKTFDEYFDRENYLTWMAINILLNNYDTMSRNFIMYSPSNLDKWYFLPWDYDVCMIYPELWENSEYSKWFGLQRYWSVPLHRRFFQNPENVKALSSKVDEVHTIFMKKDIDFRCNKYAEVFESYVQDSEADQKLLLLDYILKMPQTLTYYYEKYYERLEAPMPFFLDIIEDTGRGIYLNWQDAYDLQNDIISYDVSIFTNPEDQRNSSVWYGESEASSILIGGLTLEDGIYYWQAVAKDQYGNRQISFDRCKLEPGYNKLIMFGMKKFFVIDGDIREAEDQ